MHPPIIFDFDGTIVDSEPIANRALAASLTEHGFPTTHDEAVATYIGLRMTDCVRKAEQVHGRKLPPDFAEKCRALTAAWLADRLQPVPGAAAFVRTRTPDKIAIASSSSLSSIVRSLGIAGLAGHFDGRIFSAADIERGKPHPDIFLTAANGLGVKPTDCIVIEDGVLGVQGAVAAGMRVIGLTAASHCGPNHGKRLTKAGAHMIAKTYDDVEAFLASLS